MHLLGISGSLRKEATNRKLIREAARIAQASPFIEADLHMPLYDGDLEESHGIPDPVRALSEQIAAADAVVISTPEYNKGVSGVLKNALDWVSRTKPNPWDGKPVAILSATAGRAGGERAQFDLRLKMNPFNPRVIAGPEVLIASSSNAFDENGHLKDEGSQELLGKLMDALKAEIARG
ncbi:NADPH-dependent FMN reductase [Nereida sp. MMG025]|uniref:NADPH-dependent FMN reductase n=1 Tax=Nereida sp. MMG025 TaxID=2909981 RepID=UPI001F29051E|nr:NAD(P)H-dependent oxidoreductase [Nereida sp. MMG025]MCF6444892.1 NAD(P)H-dependent oxidoreductase [Nereida sp. MMG025]